MGGRGDHCHAVWEGFVMGGRGDHCHAVWAGFKMDCSGDHSANFHVVGRISTFLMGGTGSGTVVVEITAMLCGQVS